MAQPDDSRRQKIMVISTVAVTLVLTLIVLFAAFSPPSPEGVVNGMLNCLAEQDAEGLNKYVSGSALADLQAAAAGPSSSRWNMFWDNGAELFEDFRIGEVQISGNQAVVIVYFGPGLIQEEEFILRQENRRWKVYDINELGDD